MDPRPVRSRLTSIVRLGLGLLILAVGCSGGDRETSGDVTTRAITERAMSTTMSPTAVPTGGSLGAPIGWDGPPIRFADRWEGVDLIAWITPGSSQVLIDNLAAEVREIAGVSTVVEFDWDATYEEALREVPTIAESLTEESGRAVLPTSLRIAVPKAADRASVVRHISGNSIVQRWSMRPMPATEHATAIRCPFSGAAESLVMLWGDASQNSGERRAVREMIENDPDVVGWELTDDPEVLHAEFAEVFADRPERIARTDPEDLPWYVVIRVPTPIAVAGYGDALIRMPGVRDVVNPMNEHVFGCS